MPRSARPLLVASLVALHAAVMLCGPCLHGLPGWGHGAGPSRAADGDHDRDPIRSAHIPADDCPVCHFFSQGQLPIDLAVLPAVGHVCALRAEAPSEPVTPTLLLTTSPRAPPAPSMSLS